VSIVTYPAQQDRLPDVEFTRYRALIYPVDVSYRNPPFAELVVDAARLPSATGLKSGYLAVCRMRDKLRCLLIPSDRQTKHQQRALAGLQPRPFIQQMSRLVRGTDEANPKPLLIGLGRLYRGLGISMMRSVMTHGLLVSPD
jgi:hypothetical protein